MVAGMETRPGPDWYAFLRLQPDATAEEITVAVERLSRQASALATTAPERSQQLRETLRSIKRDLLSGPENRQRYDQSRAQARDAMPPAAPAPAGPGPGQGMGARFARFMRTGWACPNCGNGSLPNEKFCSKCGSPIHAPTRGAAAPRPAPVRNPVCANCGKQLRSADVFCGSCGTRRPDTPQ